MDCGGIRPHNVARCGHRPDRRVLHRKLPLERRTFLTSPDIARVLGTAPTARNLLPEAPTAF
jgi:hypothetical protein